VVDGDRELTEPGASGTVVPGFEVVSMSGTIQGFVTGRAIS
jgi:hypothetical protein